MKGTSDFFKSYNSAGSNSVKIVKTEKEISINNEEHIKIPYTGEPNSVLIVKKNGVVNQERYYDEKGLPYLDIDYTDHGNPKMHPFVPHEHHWSQVSNDKRKREKKGRKINE